MLKTMRVVGSKLKVFKIKMGCIIIKGFTFIYPFEAILSLLSLGLPVSIWRPQMNIEQIVPICSHFETGENGNKIKLK